MITAGAQCRGTKRRKENVWCSTAFYHKTMAVLLKLADRAESWKDLVITARTHNVPAQPTTFGKRLAMFGEDLLGAARELDRLIDTYPVRGLKGPVGTQMDLLTLFEGDAEKVGELE